MDMVLKYQDSEIRTVNQDGESWFVLNDICEILGLSNPTVTAKSLDEDELTKSDLASLGQRGGILVNESGLYSLIMRSDKPEAKQFKRWITHDVLPSIRKTGFYVDNSWTMSTHELAALLLCQHGDIMRIVGSALPKYWYHCNSIERKKPLDLNALEAFLVISKASKGGIYQYADAMPEQVRKIAIGMGVQLNLDYNAYRRDLMTKRLAL